MLNLSTAEVFDALVTAQGVVLEKLNANSRRSQQIPQRIIAG